MTKNTYFTSLCFVFYMYMYMRTTFPLSFNNKYLKYSQAKRIKKCSLENHVRHTDVHFSVSVRNSVTKCRFITLKVSMFRLAQMETL